MCSAVIVGWWVRDVPRVTCATCNDCDERSPRWHDCVTCGAILCPSCTFIDTRERYSCEGCFVKDVEQRSAERVAS